MVVLVGLDIYFCICICKEVLVVIVDSVGVFYGEEVVYFGICCFGSVYFECFVVWCWWVFEVESCVIDVLSGDMLC